MSNFNLVEHFKNNGTLTTDVGDFTFEAVIGQGGNAHVLRFKKGRLSFAVKFLEHLDRGKLERLKDEFFSAAQLSTHPNVARNYHFDRVTLGDRDFSLIVMRLYGPSLKRHGPLSSALGEAERAEQAVKLFMDLLNGLDHLHAGLVIHRDLKPENVFLDEQSGAFVIGDLGIAHFPDDLPHEAETRQGERLGNYLFSPKEQAVPGNEPAPANDLFALGQVMQWYLTGSTHRGVGRKRLSDPESPAGLRMLDAVVDACLRDEASTRPQSVAAVRDLIAEALRPSRDAVLRGTDLDRAICMSYEKIDRVWYSTRQSDIEEFIANFSRECRSEEFCCVYMNGGNDTNPRLEQLQDRRWLLNGVDEILIENLIAYRDPVRPYRSFFILLAKPDQPFQWVDADGVTVTRQPPDKEHGDTATLFDGQYMDSAIQGRRYFKHQGKAIEVTGERFSLRRRQLKKTAYLIVPNRSAASCMKDMTPIVALLESVSAAGRLDDDALSEYLTATSAHHGAEFTQWD